MRINYAKSIELCIKFLHLIENNFSYITTETNVTKLLLLSNNITVIT